MSATVTAERLAAALWNASLFTPKTGVVSGQVLFQIGSDKIAVFSCDDFIVVREEIAASDISPDLQDSEFALPIAEIKKLEADLRKIEGFIEIQRNNDLFGCLGFGIEIQQPLFEWKDLIPLLEEAQSFSSGAIAPTFYLNTERLKQIPRMKVEGDHPLAFRYGYIEGLESTIGFRLGWKIQGVITTMNDEVLLKRGVALWNEDDEAEPYIENIPIGSTMNVAGFEFTKVSDNPFEGEPEVPFDHGDPCDPPPWDVDSPTNIDLDPLGGVKAKDYNPPTRVQYTDPVDISVAPDHVNEEEFHAYGF